MPRGKNTEGEAAQWNIEAKRGESAWVVTPFSVVCFMFVAGPSLYEVPRQWILLKRKSRPGRLSSGSSLTKDLSVTGKEWASHDRREIENHLFKKGEIEMNYS